MKSFDRNLGKAKLASIPETPGIYRFYNEAGKLIYVGKAKNLRRRLAQYRNAKRRKKHAKMRKIVAEAVRLEHEVCADEFAALHLENQWIREHRPKWNVAGAFFFLYPMIGVAIAGGVLNLVYTTLPEAFPDYLFHGAFRSRERTRDGFFALTELLKLIGHAMPRPKRAPTPALPRGSTYIYGFRQIPPNWSARLDAFFRGDDFTAIEELAILLLDRPTAVAHRFETQERLRGLRLFWRHEILTLKKAREGAKGASYPIAQRDRDALFIALRARVVCVPASGDKPRRERERSRQEVR